VLQLAARTSNSALSMSRLCYTHRVACNDRMNNRISFNSTIPSLR